MNYFETVRVVLTKQKEWSALTLWERMNINSPIDMIELREASTKFGNYWGSLTFSNTIDAIDAAICAVSCPIRRHKLGIQKHETTPALKVAA